MWRFPCEVEPTSSAVVLSGLGSTAPALRRAVASFATPFAAPFAASFTAPFTAPFAVLMALLIAIPGCGDVRVVYAEWSCGHDPPSAVVVEFVSDAGGDPVAVGATGTLRDGLFVERMKPSAGRLAGSGRAFALAGGNNREGVYDVRVETSFGEVLDWSRIKVSADECGPLTVVLQARVTLH